MASSYSRQQLEGWLKRIEVPAMSKVLDVGGSQNPIQKRLGNKGEGSEYKILDLEVPHECKQKPDIIFDINEAGGRISDNYFNVIFCLEVTEYLWNPLQAFKNFNEWLDVGGLLYLSSHFIYPQHEPFEEDCLRYTPKGIEKLLKKAGFEIIENTPRICRQQEIEDSTLKGNFNTNILFSLEGMRPSKNSNAHHFVVGNLIIARRK